MHMWLCFDIHNSSLLRVRPVRSKECEMNATLRETLSLLYSNFAAADALGCICYQAIMFKFWVCK